MAKPLGVKSRVIREAIRGNPGLGNAELAELVNSSEAAKEEGLEVKAADIALQKTALKRGGGSGAPKGNGMGRKRAAPVYEPEAPVSSPTKVVTTASLASTDPVELIDKAFALAKECGGLPQLKRLVDRLAGM